MYNSVKAQLALTTTAKAKAALKADAELNISAELKQTVVRLNQIAYVFLTVCATTAGAVASQR